MAPLRIGFSDIKSEKPFYQELPFLLLHVVVALVGGILSVLLVGLLIGAILAGMGIRPPTPAVIYNPLVWLPGFLLGFGVNRIVRHRSAPYVVLVGVILLVGIMAWDVSILKHGGTYRGLRPGHYWAYEFRQLFSLTDKTCGDSECLGRILVTAPFIITVAYSIGAWLGLRFGKTNNASDQGKEAGAHTHA